MRILITGASGMIGQAVTALASQQGHEVRSLTRSQNPSSIWEWNPQSRQPILDPAAIDWADAIISLNGAPLARLPWTNKYRKEIRSSRTESTATIAAAIAVATSPPRVWVSGSAVGFYGSQPGIRLTESSPPGAGFLASVVQDWEEAAASASHATRLVLARTGVVLSNAGALRPLYWQAKLGIGGWLGSGRQYWPWVGLKDEARALLFAVQDANVIGPINVTSPNPAPMRDLAKALGRQLRRPVWLPAPAAVLRLALQDAADDLLLADQAVYPDALEAAGFKFTTPALDQALAELT